MARSTEPVVATHHLTKRYRDVVAVDRVELSVQRGQIYALLGLNGAGKTTTIRMLLGMVRPTTGHATILGTDVGRAGPDHWSRVGYLVETPAAYPELTVRENLDLVRRLRRLDERRLVDEVMDRLALLPYARRRARDLSLGNAQRLGLAKALIHGPDLLILDEPTNGLDPAGVVQIRDLLRDLAHDHATTVLLSSHLLAEVARTAGRIGILHAGRLLQELDAAELATRTTARLLVSARDLDAARRVLTAAGHVCHRVEATEFTAVALVGPAAVDRPDDIAALLVRAGQPPTRLVVDHEDLEAYFLRLVGAAQTADAA
jgi:ABC-2 type transport system ATP-binding protein